MNKDCPDAKPDKMPDDADDELRTAFADADSMAHSGYTREQIWSATGIDYGPTPNGDSPTAADTIRQARAHERTAEKPHSATARFTHRRDAAHKQALEDAEIENRKSTIENPAEAGEAPLSAGEPITNRDEGGHECKATKRACPLTAVGELAETSKRGYVRPARHESDKDRKKYQAEIAQAAAEGKLSVTSEATGQPMAFTENTVEHLRLQNDQQYNHRMDNVGNFLATAHDPDYVMEQKNGKELERVYLRAMNDGSGKKGNRGKERYFCVVEKATSMPGQMYTAYEIEESGNYGRKIKPNRITYQKKRR